MKTLKLIIAVIIAIFTVVFVIGIILPNPRVSYNTFIIEAPIENVWDKVTDYAGQTNWRDGIWKSMRKALSLLC